MTPIKAIRVKCIDCSGGNIQEVKLCNITDCPLFPFRMGHNPNIKRKELTEEQKKAIAERLSQKRQEAKGEESA